ncbi:MAG: hypothetical protein ACFB10_15410 [Salibacteraceae bacterium]
MKKLLTLLLICLEASLGLGRETEIVLPLNDSVQLRLVKTPFQAERHTVNYWVDSKEAISSIDGYPVYGTDAMLPQSELTFAELITPEGNIRLQTLGMYDPWADSNLTILYQFERFAGNPPRVKCLFSNGAGSYLVEWVIVGDKSFRTVLTNDLALLDAAKFEPSENHQEP